MIIHPILLLNQPDPDGLAPPVRWLIIDRDLRVLFGLSFYQPAYAARAAFIIDVPLPSYGVSTFLIAWDNDKPLKVNA